MRSEVVDANLEENSDLFLVLKGGVGSNYGIVTRVDMHAIESPTLWGGTGVYDRSTGPQHIEAHIEWVDQVGKYPPGSTVMAFTYSKDWGNITIVNFYQDTTGKEAPPVFDKFLAIPQKNNTFSTGSHKDMADRLSLPYGYRLVKTLAQYFVRFCNTDGQIAMSGLLRRFVMTAVYTTNLSSFTSN
jgi:hypothetical protein